LAIDRCCENLIFLLISYKAGNLLAEGQKDSQGLCHTKFVNSHKRLEKYQLSALGTLYSRKMSADIPIYSLISPEICWFTWNSKKQPMSET
jgi:hypothetical protein